MDKIKKLQEKLTKLVQDSDKNGGQVTKEDAMTFLTEQYPPNKILTKKDLTEN